MRRFFFLRENYEKKRQYVHTEEYNDDTYFCRDCKSERNFFNNWLTNLKEIEQDFLIAPSVF